MKKYSFIKGYPIDYNERSDDNHVYIHLLAGNRDYSLAVNTASNLAISRLFYYREEIALSTFLERMHLKADLSDDLYRQDLGKKTHYLDYRELGLFDKNCFKAAEGSSANTTELHAYLRSDVETAIKSPENYVICFGSLWGPKEKEEDWTFHFRPGAGLHDIHCNQYSPSGTEWEKKDSPKEDGGIFFVDVEKEKVTGYYFIFMAR